MFYGSKGIIYWGQKPKKYIKNIYTPFKRWVYFNNNTLFIIRGGVEWGYAIVQMRISHSESYKQMPGCSIKRNSEPNEVRLRILRD